MTAQPRIHGRYRVDERLGATRIATVYRAYDDKLNRPVLLNLMRSHLVDQRGIRERFISDSELRARNVHSALPEVYDSGTIEDRPFFITEFVTGKTLRARAPVTPIEALQYIRHIVAVIKACQESHIPHPPISSNDFVVISEGHVKWIENWTLTPNEVLIDIASYRSPERQQGSAETVESAIYAVGILLFEILGGFRPFSGTNADEILTQHESSDIPPVSAVVSAGCPPEIDDLIMRCTARNYRNRLNNLDELLELIEQARRDIVIGGNGTGPLGDNQPPSATQTTPQAGTQPRKRRQRNRTLGRVLISLLVLGGLGAGGWYYVSSQPAQSDGLLSGISLRLPSISLPRWASELFSDSNGDMQTLLVGGDAALELYDEPASNGSVVGSIPAGARVEWVDGPQSADGTVWLKIRYTADMTIVEGWAPQKSLITTP
jgi:eukaryotic-like serine/threonine-protein kinase